jgi:hypothetical protein
LLFQSTTSEKRAIHGTAPFRKKIQFGFLEFYPEKRVDDLQINQGFYRISTEQIMKIPGSLQQETTPKQLTIYMVLNMRIKFSLGKIKRLKLFKAY